MRNDLGVGFALEGVPQVTEVVPQLDVIFDDPVVDHDDGAGLVGVGVGLRWPAMGGPAGVADADGPAQGFLREKIFQVEKLSLAPPGLGAARFDGADPGRIIAAVFQPLEAVKDDGGCYLVTDETYYAAHDASGRLTRGAGLGGKPMHFAVVAK